MPFGQLVIGPPGSGKTTYCIAMQQFMRQLGRRCYVVNLDPANDVNSIDYDCALDIQDLISLEVVMEEMNLGPNGALVYCMEYLEKNMDWLHDRLEELQESVDVSDDVVKNSGEVADDNPFNAYGVSNTTTNDDANDDQRMKQMRKQLFDHSYFLFDCPGQIELYTNHDCVKNIADSLQKWNYRICAVHLVDSHYCSDASKFIAAVMMSLSTMVRMELPHINVLSKIDLIQQHGKLAFDIEYYTDVQDLSYLVRSLEEDEEEEEKSTVHNNRFAGLNKAIAEVIGDYGLVSFCTLNIMDKRSMLATLKWIDKANGYIFGGLSDNNESIQDIAHDNDQDWAYNRFDDVRQKYLQDSDDDDEDDTI